MSSSEDEEGAGVRAALDEDEEASVSESDSEEEEGGAAGSAGAAAARKEKRAREAKAAAELFDEALDDKDELWVEKQRAGGETDAVLSCPLCFTTLSLLCQQHERYHTQFRAVFVRNCVLSEKEQLRSVDGEVFAPVLCRSCRTEVGVRDADEVVHFHNVIASQS
jgi:hypothetical protein